MAAREWMEKDYYGVLGVDKNASKADIKRAYRRLAQQYHPDANKGDPTAEARFKEISEAHSILSNDDKRAEYDQVRRLVEAGGERFYGFGPGSGSVRVNIGDLFGSEDLGGIFGDMFGFSGARQRRGADLEADVELSFDEAVHGTTRVLPGGARVRIPAGVRDGARIRVSGKGEPGGAGAGDLYVRVHVAPHPVFSLGANGQLTVTVPVTIAEAALGANIAVPTLDGSVTVKVPPGTQSGKTLRVKGRGAPRSKGGNGDLMVKVDVQVPRKLSRQEKKLLEEFAAVHKSSPREHLEGYMRRAAAS